MNRSTGIMAGILWIITMVSCFIIGVNYYYGYKVAHARLDEIAKEAKEATEEIMDNYDQCVLDGYTVYLDGEEITHPDKLDPRNYTITIDDTDKEIMLSRK